MKIITYTFEPKMIQKYCNLIRKIYEKNPNVLGLKTDEVERSLNPKNPFFEHGEIQNFLLKDKGEVVGHISAVIDFHLPGHVGLIGFFETAHKGYGKPLLKAVHNYFIAKQRKIIKGPVNLSTWQNFRFSQDEKRPPFFGEPFNKSFYPTIFEKYGFTLAQENISFLGKLDDPVFLTYKEKYAKIKNEFQFIRLTSKNVQKDKKDIHMLIQQTFNRTWTFSPINFTEFDYIYRKLFERIDQHFVYLVRPKDRKLVAFFVCLRDIFSSDTVVAKIMGVLPAYQKRGIGSSLFYLFSEDALASGLKKIIYSTMKVGNTPIENMLTANHLDIYRRYMTFELEL